MISGLSRLEAEKRLELNGENILISQKKISVFLSFLKEFKSPLIIIIFAASIISFVTGSYASAIIIVIIVIISSIMDFFVSYKSQRAVETLLKKVAIQTTVVRDGKEQKILASKIVVGDIVVIEAGNVIPADGIVKEGHDLFVNESSLTGESIPVEKEIGSSVYLGSNAVSGRVYVEITNVAKKTKFAEIVLALEERPRVGEFERGIKDFSILITKVVIIMSVIVFIANLVLKHQVLDSLIFSLAIAVGVTPELLPMIIAFSVSRASLKMSDQGVIVKKISSIENFGSMDILCTDKTGTLTEDRMSLVKFLDIEGQESIETLQRAYIVSDFHTGTKAPSDKAVIFYKSFDLSGYKKIDEIPFDFERRRDSVVYEFENKKHIIVRGAPEHIFPVSNMSELEIEKAKKVFNSLAQDGYYVLAIASKEFKDKKYNYNSEKDLSFNGFIAFIDLPKKGVKQVLNEISSLGVEIKIITGDYLLSAEKIAKEVGLTIKGVLTSDEIEKISDAELSIVAQKTNIFARITPSQKNRIIKALQSAGHVVGYMGDGINDAPSLRTADVGISVSNAVDVAKESADIILLNKNFEHLIYGITEGRRTFVNTNKYISMAISSNFGNMFSMTAASLFLPFFPMLPAQILLNNLLYEGSQFSVTTDNVDQSLVSKPNPWDINHLKKIMYVFGGVSSIFDFLTFFILYKVFLLSGAAFQTGWFIESFATQTLVIFLIRSRHSIFKAVSPSRILGWSIITAVVTAWTIALTGLGKIFGFVPLPLNIIFAIIGIVIVYLIIVEITKNFFYKTKKRK